MNIFKSMWIWSFAVVLISFTSCSADDDNSESDIGDGSGIFTNGVFILNEGNFGSANASVSFLNDNGEMQNDIFELVNGHLLGDTAQQILIEEDFAYILLNGSSSIEVVNKNTFEHIQTISSGLNNPRYMEIEDGKAFVSNWGDPANPSDDFIAVVSLSTGNVFGTIPVAEGPDKMEKANGKIFVAHSGGWNIGNLVSVINEDQMSLVGSIQVGDYPNSLVEKNGKLYVLCGGKPAWTGDETLAALYVINTADHSVQSHYNFEASKHPTLLVEDDSKLYYTIDSDVYSMNIGFTSFPTSPLFSTLDEGVFGIYGFDVEDGKIFVADAGDFNSRGKVFVYNNNGSLLNEYQVGFLPNYFAFND